MTAGRRCPEPRWRTRRGPWPDVGVPSRAGGPDVVRGRELTALASWTTRRLINSAVAELGAEGIVVAGRSRRGGTK